MIVTDNSNIVLDREYKEVFFRPAKVNVAIAVTILFLIWPMLALPCVIVEVLNRRKYSFVLLTIFMGYIDYLWPPTGDLYRHTLSYFEFKYSSSYMLREYQEDYVMHILSFIFPRLCYLCGFLQNLQDLYNFIVFYTFFHTVLNRFD